MSKSQNQRILARLKMGLTITPIQALDLFGCLRLAARVHELRLDGYDITKTTASKNGKNFAQYSLSKLDQD